MALTRAQYATFCHDALVLVLSNQPETLAQFFPRLVNYRQQGASQAEAVDTLLNELGITGHRAKHIMVAANVDSALAYDVPVLVVP